MPYYKAYYEGYAEGEYDSEEDAKKELVKIIQNDFPVLEDFIAVEVFNEKTKRWE